MGTTAARAGRRSLVDAAGRAVRLGKELGRGGEGSVFDVEDASDLVAKLYLHDDPEKALKLPVMARVATPALTSVAAWPTNTLHDRLGAPACGFLMPRVAGAEVHRLYSPAYRKAEFPNYDWEKLIVVARNVAAAVARIHDAGHVIGDVNQGNVLVSPTGVVRLIDCDSFQIRDGATWRLCKVGVAHFTPPELQGQSFQGVVRTQNHDAFGLAVLVFHLLFMGRHPFAGRYGGRGDMPLEQAITEFRFAFGRNAGAVQMAPPPNALPLASASTAVADLFERAFAPARAQPGGRPTAVQWVAALDALRAELTACAASSGHKYHRSLGAACPWCAIERAGGPDFFVSVVAAIQAATGGFDLQAVWAQIAGLRAPEAAPALPVVAGQPAATAPISRVRRLAWKAHGVTGVLAGLALLGTLQGDVFGAYWAIAAVVLGVACGMLRAISNLAAERRTRADALKSARAALAPARERWGREAAGAADRFASRRRELEAVRAEYTNLDTAKRHERQQLEAQRRERQLQQHLERHYVEGATLRNVGPTLKATLRSYGIETAADVSPAAVHAVPGFGPARVATLCDWRERIAAKFVFDPARGVDPRDLQALDAKYARRWQGLERALTAGAGELRLIIGAAEQVQSQLRGELAQRLEAVAVAESNVKAAA